MLAAGVGRRLAADGAWRRPKALLAFGGRSLLERHIAILRAAGVTELVVVTGYRAAEIEAEAERTAPPGFVRFIGNPRYEQGSLLSLHAAAALLAEPGEDILYMDADVLYHPALIERLVGEGEGDRIPYDRGFLPGEEPVKICLRERRVVDFGKQVSAQYDDVGEWPGFLRLSAQGAAALGEAAATLVARGADDAPAEDAIHRWLRASADTVTPVDVSGIPWIEIDFAEDIARAEREVLPKLPT